MSSSPSVFLATALTAGALTAFPADPREGSAADPKDVRFTRAGVVSCPSARVVAGTTGEVRRVLRAEGDAVKAGEVLAELHDPELAAELKLAEAELALAVATEKEFIATKGEKIDASPAKEQLARLAAQVKVAGARLDALKVRAAALVVRSPIEGVVGKKSAEIGNYVRKGDTELFTVFDLSKPELVVDVPELDAPNVTKGQRCTIRIDAYADREFAGEVDRAEPVVADTLTNAIGPFARPDLRPREVFRTARVYVTLRLTKETETFRPLPGMGAQVAFGKPN